MTKGSGIRGLGAVAIGLAFGLASQGCMPRGVPKPPSRTAAPCPDLRAPVRVVFAGWPPHGLILDDVSYGGTASWTAEGAPPAGDRCSRPPPSVPPSVSSR
jgi:hypothetical protein